VTAASFGARAEAPHPLLLVTEVIIWTIEGVAFPTFSRLHGQPERIKRAFHAVTQLCLAVATPAFLTLAVLAPELTRVAFGPQWTDAGPVMRTRPSPSGP